MNREEIKKLLPHRDSMLLIDEVELKDDIAFGQKTIHGDEWFLNGHFPGNPVVPGVILCEILAQSACVLLGTKISDAATPYFTGLDQVRFKKVVHVNDVIKTQCKITKSKGVFYWASGKAYINGEVCVTAEFSFALINKQA